MGEKLYRLIPEPGKHLANAKDTFGAVRGVYLDDKTNKPSGAGEFMPVDTNSTGVSPAVVGALVTLGLAAGYGIAKATPYVIKWVRGSAIPWVKRTWNTLWKTNGRESRTAPLQLPEHSTYVLEEVSPTDVSHEIVYEHRENMTSEEALQRLIDSFILILKGCNEASRVANANIVFPSGEIVDGRKIIQDEGIIAQINAAIRSNPNLLSKEQHSTLSSVLGYDVFKDGVYQPITVQAIKSVLPE